MRVIWLVTEGTVEEDILTMQRRKRLLDADLLGSEKRHTPSRKGAGEEAEADARAISRMIHSALGVRVAAT